MLRWISLVLCAGAFACASDSQEADKTDAGLNSNVTPLSLIHISEPTRPY